MANQYPKGRDKRGRTLTPEEIIFVRARVRAGERKCDIYTEYHMDYHNFCKQVWPENYNTTSTTKPLEPAFGSTGSRQHGKYYTFSIGGMIPTSSGS